MKALSIKQPWAWAIIHGKPVENRDWKYPPKYRGPFLIHASKTFDMDGYSWLFEHRETLDINPGSFPDPQDFISLNGKGFGTGGIVAKTNLIAIISDGGIHKMGGLSTEQHTYIANAYHSPFFFGPMGLVLFGTKETPFLQYKGQRGWFNVPDKLIVGAK